MEKDYIYNLVILDESGSMESIKRAAVSGCNETIQSIHSIQKEHSETQLHFLSLVSFNSCNSTKILYDKVPIENAKELSSKEYLPDNCTPLYDAMGLSFKHLQNTINKKQKNSVFVTVITDGLENASTIFDAWKLNSMINELKLKGWTFAYIGANQDAVLEGEKIGIQNTIYFEADEKGTKTMFEQANTLRSYYANKVSEGASSEEMNAILVKEGLKKSKKNIKK